MPSANGFRVGDPDGGSHVAVWPAPFFVLECTEEWAEVGDRPIAREWALVHCDDLEHAQRRLRLGDRGSAILNHDFTEWQAAA